MNIAMRLGAAFWACVLLGLFVLLLVYQGMLWAQDAPVVDDPPDVVVGEPTPTPTPTPELTVMFRMQMMVELLSDGSVRPAAPPPSLTLSVAPDWTWQMTRETP